jgi:hypothetical protein
MRPGAEPQTSSLEEHSFKPFSAVEFITEELFNHIPSPFSSLELAEDQIVVTLGRA